MKSHPRPLWIYLSLCALIIAVYGQVVRFEFTNYDDPDYVTQNPHVTSGLTLENVSWAMTTGYAANWHPLTWLSHMVDVRLFGLDGGRHHLTNVVLHALSTMLLFAVLWRMTGAFWCSAFVAAFFALHPLRAESVAWIAERKDALGTFFWMLTLFLYARYVERPNAWRYGWIVIVYALGLMSKSMLVTLPFTLLLLDVWPLHRIDRNNLRSRITEKVPLLAISAAVSVITYMVQQRGGAVMSFSLVPFSVRLENAFISYVAYLRMLFWPAGLAAIYPFPSAIPLWQPFAAAAVITAISLVVWLQRRSHPYLIVGWLWYLGTLVPVLGLIQVGEQAHADRYTYIPSVGILLMVAWGVWDLVQRKRILAPVATVTAIAALAVCSIFAARQVSYWRNTFALFNHAIAVTADNYIAYDALGTLMLSQDRPVDAVPYIRKALEYNPYEAQAHSNMGLALDDLGRTAEAQGEFRHALQLDPANADAQSGLGLVLAENGAADESLAHMREALRLRPDYAHDYFKLGEVYGLLDKLPEAEQAFRDSIRLDPSDPRSYFNLGIALGKQGRLPEAIDAFRTTLRLKPTDAAAWFNLGNALAQQDHLAEAVSAFSEAIRLKPDFSDAQDALDAARQLLRQHP